MYAKETRGSKRRAWWMRIFLQHIYIQLRNSSYHISPVFMMNIFSILPALKGRQFVKESSYSTGCIYFQFCCIYFQFCWCSKPSDLTEPTKFRL